jgi:hypothetical protein
VKELGLYRNSPEVPKAAHGFASQCMLVVLANWRAIGEIRGELQTLTTASLRASNLPARQLATRAITQSTANADKTRRRAAEFWRFRYKPASQQV